MAFQKMHSMLDSGLLTSHVSLERLMNRWTENSPSKCILYVATPQYVDPAGCIRIRATTAGAREPPLSLFGPLDPGQRPSLSVPPAT